MRSYTQYVAAKQREYGARFKETDLSAKFRPYYESQARIEVAFGHGEVKRGRVSVTTGWRPSFLLMLTRRSIGSIWLLGDDCKIIRQVAN